MNEKEISQKIQELQVLEQNLQGILIQKQSFQIQLNESSNALEELKNSDDEVYKILGEIMIKSDKEKLSKELEEKKKLSELRIGSLEKQENLLAKKSEELKEEISSAINKNKS